MQVATPPRPATQSPQGQGVFMPPPMAQGQYQGMQYQVLGPVPVSASPILQQQQQQPRFPNTAQKRGG